MMTSMYTDYLGALARRDQTLIMLTLMALVLVTAWVGVDWLPERIRPGLRTIYMAGGLILFLIQLGLCLVKG